MKLVNILVLIVSILLLPCIVWAVDPPGIINYQGTVAVNGEPFDSPPDGLFMFALVDATGTTFYWSNDGNVPPTTEVPVPVSAGRYSVALGTTNAIPASVFADHAEVYLRVWFNDGTNGSQLLSPDQRIASVGYALSAGEASDVADGSITTAKLADEAVTEAKIRTGYNEGDLNDALSGLDLSGLASGTALFSTTFPEAFVAGSTPEVTLPEGWSTSAVSEAGFSATFPVLPQGADLSGDVGDGSSLAMVDGRPAIAYHDSSSSDLKFVIAQNSQGTSWGVKMTIDSNGSTGLYPSLAVVDGRPAIAYYDSSSTNIEFIIAEDAAGTNWGQPVIADSGAVFPGEPSLAVVSGRPAISFIGGTNDLKYVRASNAEGTSWGSSVTVDSSSPSVGDFNSLAVANGRPAISYYDAINQKLKYVRASNSTGSSWGTPLTLDGQNGTTAFDVGKYTSLKVVDGRPAISYYEANSDDLKYVRANDADGTSWGTPVPVDTGGDVGAFSALAVVDGRPAIAYFDESNDDLKYAVANDITGTSWTTTTVLNGGDVGRDLSLALIGEQPAISFHDASNDDLEYLALPSAPLWTATDGQAYPVAVEQAGIARNALSVVDGAIELSDLSVEVGVWNNVQGTMSTARNVLAEAGVQVGSSDTVIQEGRIGNFGSADGFEFDDKDGLLFETKAGGESGGIFINGDTAALWNPGDDSLLKIYDEDGMVLRFEVDGGGSLNIDDISDPTISLQSGGTDEVSGRVSMRQSNGTGFDMYYDGTNTEEELVFESFSGGASTGTRMVMELGGNIGIGTDAPTARLSVFGGANNLTGTWTFFSDRRLKEDISPMTDGSLERLLRLEGVTFRFNQESMQKDYPHAHRGWIAQEVEKVFPEWVSETDEGMKMVTPVGFNALTVEALRELRAEKDAAIAVFDARITEKDSRIERLETENTFLRTQTEAMRKRLERLEALVDQLSN